MFYSLVAAIVSYNLGYWLSWYDFFTNDDEKERQDNNTTFSGKHYLGQLTSCQVLLSAAHLTRICG
jgi:hypothetical protein